MWWKEGKNFRIEAFYHTNHSRKSLFLKTRHHCNQSLFPFYPTQCYHKQNLSFLWSNTSFLSKAEAKNSREDGECVLLQVLAPGLVVVCCRCSCCGCAAPSPSCLGSSSFGRHKGWWDSKQGGLKGWDAGRCHACSQGGKEEKVAGGRKKNTDSAKF